VAGRSLLLAGAAVVLLGGCQPASERSQCVEQVLASFTLPSGTAVFTDTDGTLGYAPRTPSGWMRKQRQWPAASLTKPLVAAEIRRLIEADALRLDTPVAQALGRTHGRYDPALGHTTVRHLLQHTAGLDRASSGDPLWREDGEPDCSAAAARLLQGPLDYPPGQRVAYSNAGYCVLGEILKRHAPRLDRDMRRVLQSGLGAAGGWSSPLDTLHGRLRSTLPIPPLAPMARLADGSYYTYGWRYWPAHQRTGAPWTHTGRLPRMLAVALSDGADALLVAHFSGDPADWEAASQDFNRKAWQCMHLHTPPLTTVASHD